MLLKERLAEVADVGASSLTNAEVRTLRSELESERKMKLASGVQQYERSCMFMGEIQDRDEKIGIKNSEIVDMKRHLDELRKSLKILKYLYLGSALIHFPIRQASPTMISHQDWSSTNWRMT